MNKMLAIFSLLILTSSSFAYSGNPPDNRAGNPPGNMSCVACHSSFDLNSGNGLLIVNYPGDYEPSTTYDIEVTVWDPGQTRWGFELTSLDENNDQAGSFIVTDNQHTQLSDNSGLSPDFMKHTSDGTFAGDTSGTWTFQWTSPPEGTGDVTFYIAGNAANGNGSTSGDYIYTHSVVNQEITSDVEDNFINLPKSFAVSNSYPNPFNSTTLFNISSEKSGLMNVRVVDLLGRVISQDNFQIMAGSHRYAFDAHPSMTNSTYFLQFTTGDQTITRKVIYLK